MRTITYVVLVATLLTLHTAAFAQTRPKIAYAYPAGGERGTTVDVLLGGRQIARADGVFVSGKGVSGTVLATYASTRINDADERDAVRRFYIDAKVRLLYGANEVLTLPESTPVTAAPPMNASEDAEPEKPIITLEQMMRKYPYLDKLEDPTHLDLQRLFYEHYHVRPDRWLPRDTMAQMVFVRLTIEPDALPGDRELYLTMPNMVTSPIRFVVGTLPEVSEIEPNDTESPVVSEWMPGVVSDERIRRLPQAQRDELVRRAGRNIETLDTLTLPVVVNGQIRGGDVDRFRFHAERGQKLVFAMQARHLIPYLADAVPGWFQGMLTLYGPNGQEFSHATSYRFEPDPLICFEVPETGVYTIEVRDTLFRGRDDFVYRISMGETPLVTAVFPLGGQIGDKVETALQGWNLPATAVRFDTSFSSPSMQMIREVNGHLLLRPIRYAVDTLPEIVVPASADNLAVTLPVMINGRILTATGVDSFQFTGRAGETMVCDVAARSLDSMLDAVLELVAPDGTVIAHNDDRADSKGPNIGLGTHHADPYLLVTLPADGTYTVRLYDVQQRGGPECAYRLRISPPRPGFAVYCTPSAVALGSPQRLTFKAVRYDGFVGEITITAPVPFQLSKAVIPADADSVTAALSATNRFNGRPQSLQLSATGQVGDRNIATTVMACDEYEQAFIYHHLVPTAYLTILSGRGQQ